MEFYSDGIHKARKEHKCIICNQIIAVGEKYHRQSGKYEGDFFDRCLHMTCNKMMDGYCEQDADNEFTVDGIYDWLREIYCYDCDKDDDCEVDIFRCEKIVSNFLEDNDGI